MDFDIAARRLQKDQQSALARTRAGRSARTAGAKARREAASARREAEARLAQRKLEGERRARVADAIARRLRRVEGALGVADVAPSVPGGSRTGSPANGPLAGGWTFAATSIHGEGDKIALPPSVLEAMTSGANDLDPWGSGGNGGRPVAFRIGVPNPNYEFPSGDKMKALAEKAEREIIASEKNELARRNSTASEVSNSGSMDEGMLGSDDEDEGDDSDVVDAYLDELSHRYLSYTHGTVVEFTQENGCVGLPQSIAAALLQPNSHSLAGNALARRKEGIPVGRTADPAPAAGEGDGSNDESDEKREKEDAMDADAPGNRKAAGEGDGGDGSERTPGHPAYGLFDVPALPVEVTPVNSLPPGKNCTFTPTASSIQNGFYALKDVKSVLEQSLMRTRATLSRGDAIRTWRRGVSFDLIVSGLSPAEYGAVSCVNTDLNVDIGPPEGDGADGTPAETSDNAAEPAQNTNKPTGGGRLLSEPPPPIPRESAASPADAASVELPPEPAANATEGVCSIQIRGRTRSGGSAAGRRRFDVTAATVSHLFAFASLVCDGADPSAFRLVARFPRRVIRTSPGEGRLDADASLESAGIGQGQETFMVESV